jgi:predicted alpha/beta superfamily hydrolase
MPRARKVAPGSFVELGTFEAPGLRPRRVRAYVPRTPTGRRRPALVLFDGQNVFGDEGSYAGGWHVHGAVDRLAARGPIVAPVVIAVDHGAEERIDELAPWSDGKRGGRADALLDLVVGKVLPAAHAKLPLIDAKGAHVIGGSSMGGLAAVYAHLARPDTFYGALAMSPSLWFARARILEHVANCPLPPRSRFYIDGGAREMKGVLLATCHALAGVLRARGWVDGTSRAPQADRTFWLRPDAKGTHAESHWRRRLPRALRFLFA